MPTDTPTHGFPEPGASQFPPDSVRTLAQLFAWRVHRSPDATAYQQADAHGRWHSLSWRDMGERVSRWSRALAAMRLPRQSRVGVLLPNGLDAVCVDQAALANGCVPVPMHLIDNPGSIAYILRDSEASLLVVQSRGQWEAIRGTIEASAEPLPALREVVLADGEALEETGPVPVVGAERWLRAAEGRDAAIAGPTEEDLAAIVYTSGTTGKPKGVMLTHGNVLSNVRATLARVVPGPQEVFLSFLPLSHTFERTIGYYLPVAAGAVVAFARSVKDLPEDLRTIRPTILVSVPRIYERVYGQVQTLLAASPLKRRLFQRAVQVGWRRFCREQGLPVEAPGPTWLDALQWPLLERLVARPLQRQFGGRLRVAVSGGAPLPPAIARCFLGLGVPIVQGYGMTETSPVIAANAPEDNDPFTVGRVLQGVEVRIGDNRELLVRGPGVMRGYWHREDDTRSAFVDGWLRTGDQAALENGRLRILGRVKEIIVTSTGEKIAPADLEQAIAADPLFAQVWAFGDNRPFIGCAVVLDPSRWEALARELGVDARDPASLQSDLARRAIVQRLRELTASFPHYAQPRGAIALLDPWTVENGLLTPTLKLKRKNLETRYADQIERLYTERRSA
ncbi:MAG TPA: long-chain fatty acid--CoA ligase [Burkholderiaceae bacterium]|nr:long-chain fatty acid--CoA ligase [Burkholderiaceae bacterium]